VNLGGGINTRWHDRRPEISSDGLSLYFNSDRPNNNNDKGFRGTLFVSHRKSTQAPWGKATLVAIAGNDGAIGGVVSPSLTSSGLTLVFHSGRAGGKGRTDLWMATRTSKTGPWGQPMHLGVPVNAHGYDLMPSISKDGRTLFFVSDRPGGHGNADLWMSRRLDRPVSHISTSVAARSRGVDPHEAKELSGVNPLPIEDEQFYLCHFYSNPGDGGQSWHIPLLRYVTVNGHRLSPSVVPHSALNYITQSGGGGPVLLKREVLGDGSIRLRQAKTGAPYYVHLVRGEYRFIRPIRYRPTTLQFSEADEKKLADRSVPVHLLRLAENRLVFWITSSRDGRKYYLARGKGTQLAFTSLSPGTESQFKMLPATVDPREQGPATPPATAKVGSTPPTTAVISPTVRVPNLVAFGRLTAIRQTLRAATTARPVGLSWMERLGRGCSWTV
jgi:hypothetical protein